MNKNKGIIGIGFILAIVLGIVAVGGGAYYLGKNKEENKKTEDKINIENQVENNNKEVIGVEKSIDKNITKTQVNINAGYQVDYPSDWYVKSSDTKISSNGNYGYNSFNILNTKDAVLPGSDFTLKANGSYIDISVNTNMNYSNYEEFIKDPKTDLPKLAKDERIANLKIINIGGKTLQGLNSFKNGLSGGSYVFIYNKKLFDIGISSGSEEQYTKDKKVFEDMVSSFKFLDSEESATETFKNQPGAIKSIKTDGANKWILAVDLLSNNPNWQPGVNDRYLNQNTKIRNLNVTSLTKAYGCGSNSDGQIIEGATLKNITEYVSGVGKDIAQTKLDIKNRIEGPIEKMTDFKTLRFDIDGSNITAIYDICLP